MHPRFLGRYVWPVLVSVRQTDLARFRHGKLGSTRGIGRKHDRGRRGMELFRRWGSARAVLTWRRGRRVRARLWAVGKDADVQADVQVDVQALYKCLRAFTRDWRMHKLRAHGGQAAQGGWEGYQPNFARRANVSIIYYKCPPWPLTPPPPPISIRNRGGGASFVQSARALMRIERGRSRRQAAPGMLWGRSAWFLRGTAAVGTTRSWRIGQGLISTKLSE